jgi:hypothetical protein
MLLGAPVKRLLRRAAKGRLEKAELAVAGLATAAAALLLLLLCAASLRCSATALVAAHGRLWAGGVSIAAAAAAEADAAVDVDKRPVSAPATASAGSGGDEEEECDLFDGEWVWAGGGGYPLYDSRDCPFLDVGFRCAENGRPDASYTKWRWQPSRCHLPRFGFVASICCYLLPCFRRVPCPPSPESGDWFAKLVRAEEACVGILLSPCIFFGC